MGHSTPSDHPAMSDLPPTERAIIAAFVAHVRARHSNVMRRDEIESAMHSELADGLDAALRGLIARGWLVANVPRTLNQQQEYVLFGPGLRLAQSLAQTKE